jgi:hypothetical protein
MRPWCVPQVVGRSLLPRLFALLTGFVRRPHARLAAVGVEALVRLVNDCGALFAAAEWDVVLTALAEAVGDTLPDVYSLVRPNPLPFLLSHPRSHRGWTLRSGVAGADSDSELCKMQVGPTTATAAGSEADDAAAVSQWSASSSNAAEPPSTTAASGQTDTSRRSASLEGARSAVNDTAPAADGYGRRRDAVSEEAAHVEGWLRLRAVLASRIATQQLLVGAALSLSLG